LSIFAIIYKLKPNIPIVCASNIVISFIFYTRNYFIQWYTKWFYWWILCFRSTVEYQVHQCRNNYRKSLHSIGKNTQLAT